MKKSFYLISYTDIKTNEKYTKIRITKADQLRSLDGRYFKYPKYLVNSIGIKYDSLKELYEGEELFICKTCGQIASKHYYNLREDTCINCSIWLNLIDANDDNTIITEDYERYHIVPDNPNATFKGFGGREFTITKMDGSQIITRNLWHQGFIPQRFRHLVIPNTKLIIP